MTGMTRETGVTRIPVSPVFPVTPALFSSPKLGRVLHSGGGVCQLLFTLCTVPRQLSVEGCLESSCEFYDHLIFPLFEVAGDDVFASLANKPEVECYIVERGNLCCHHLARDIQVAKVGL